VPGVVRAQQSEPRSQSGTLQGERGRAAFFLETGKAAPLAASLRERQCRPYLASGIVTGMGANRSAGSVAPATNASPKGTPK
jgi:hypothetical protein